MATPEPLVFIEGRIAVRGRDYRMQSDGTPRLLQAIPPRAEVYVVDGEERKLYRVQRADGVYSGGRRRFTVQPEHVQLVEADR